MVINSRFLVDMDVKHISFAKTRLVMIPNFQSDLVIFVIFSILMKNAVFIEKDVT